MKRVGSVLFSIFVLLILASCAADDSSLLRGKLEKRWYYHQTVSYYGNEKKVEIHAHAPGGCEKDYVEFLDEGAFNDVHFYGPDCKSTLMNASWQRTGTAVTITNEEEVKTYIIEVLIGNQLRLKERIGTGDEAYDKVTYFKIL